jgi:two-component system response regulator AtoC
MKERILVVDDDASLRESLELFLSQEGYAVTAAGDANGALACIGEQSFGLVLCDVRMPGIDGLELLPQLVRRAPGTTVIMMSAYGNSDLAVEALNLGAYDYLIKPFQPSEVVLAIRKAAERERYRRKSALLKREVVQAVGQQPIIAASEPMVALLDVIERAAEYKATVLLLGESGTGKEVLARSIQAQSGRADEAFVAVNCGAIPENLLESELFGHAKGAFTGADRARRGLFTEAHGGTLFLDEIGELPAPLQVKLLRVLQEEEIRPVGDSKSHQVDVRVIAATSRDLAADVESGRFREDLFYRLDVIRIDVPPLRERERDIPLMVDAFVSHFAETLGKPVRAVSHDALQRLVAHGWPGNVRELKNVIERAIILARGDTVTTAELPTALGTENASVSLPTHDLSLKAARARFERDWIQQALDRVEGNRTHAAKALGISHRSLLYKIKEYGIGR